MKGPDDDEGHENVGCYLEVVKNQRLTWTDALEADFRPTGKSNECIGDHFSATVLLKDENGSTKYTVIARHSSEESCKTHNERGFEEGWGTALTQMVELIKSAEIQ